jgi:outer membrane receptor for ferrienterochelin and colicins
MRLPIVPNDFRREYSPWFSLQNIQLTKTIKHYEWYGGLKNILNFMPDHPILRPFDPFDKTADDPVSNPNGYRFDPSYNFAPLQGIRFFAGFRYTFN